MITLIILTSHPVTRYISLNINCCNFYNALKPRRINDMAKPKIEKIEDFDTLEELSIIDTETFEKVWKARKPGVAGESKKKLIKALELMKTTKSPIFLGILSKGRYTGLYKILNEIDKENTSSISVRFKGKAQIKTREGKEKDIELFYVSLVPGKRIPRKKK